MLVCKDSTTHAVVTKIIVRLVVNYVKACKNVEYTDITLTDITLTELGKYILHSHSPLLGYSYLKWNYLERKTL